MHKQFPVVLPTALVALVLSACGPDAQPTPQAAANPPQQKAQPAPVEKGSSEGIAMVRVPAGQFIRGSNKTDEEGLQKQYGFTNPLFLDEHPQHKMHLDAFMIDSYEVSNIQFKEFIVKTKRLLPYEWGHNGYGLTMEEAVRMDMERLRKIGADDFKLDMDTRTMSREALIDAMQKEQQKKDNLPVTGITWDYANEYCQWRGQRLPTEAEWEKAARGTDGIEFPWGNKWDTATTNTGDDSDWEDGYAPVGSYPQNKSPYGAFDMGGNVFEWTASWYQPYPGSSFTSPNYGDKNKVIRGGGGGIGHYALSYFFRAATRQFADPNMASEDVGFRCAKDI